MAPQWPSGQKSMFTNHNVSLCKFFKTKLGEIVVSENLSVFCLMSVIFSGHSGFLYNTKTDHIGKSKMNLKWCIKHQFCTLQIG